MEFGERTQDCSPGHAGKEDPHLAMTGASCWFLELRCQCAVSDEVRREAQRAFRVVPGKSGLHAHGKEGARHCSRDMVRESGLKIR